MNFGLGLLIAATAPSLRAQRDPLGPTSGNSAADQAGQTAPQSPKPATPSPAKPATQTAPAAKPGAPAPAKPAAQNPAKPATQTQAKPAPPVPAKPATGPAAAQTARPSPQAAAKPGLPGAAKPTAQPAAKPVKKKGAAKAPKKVEKPAGPAGAPQAPVESELRAARRDPFESLIAHSQNGKGPANLPQGKAGLQVSTLRLDGIVRSPNGMIAVVSNPQARTYFLREGDHLYDGSVEKITMDGVSFHEEGKDAFGKPVERQVNKRIYSTSSGEQQ
jgi:Tfp pilus assembly protein PilP